jgi:hypothetical protein
LKPIAAGPLPKTVEFDVNNLSELPTNKPPLDLQFGASKSLVTGLTELQIFQKLLTLAIIDIIVNVLGLYGVLRTAFRLFEREHCRFRGSTEGARYEGA